MKAQQKAPVPIVIFGRALQTVLVGAVLYASLNLWILFVQWAASACTPFGMCR